MPGGWTDPDDRRLARSIFADDDRARVCAALADWVCGQGLGAAIVTDIELSVGAAVTLALPDRRRLFVKVWPAGTDPTALAAQTMVQRRLRERGFPAPAVLAGPAPLGSGVAVAMAHERPGVATDATRPAVRTAMAAGLARLIALATELRDLDGLPERRWPAADALWPRPHNALFDFAATRRGAEWIDAIAADALRLLYAATGPIVVGHDDWSAKNVRMGDDGIAMVYDWDSVFRGRETGFVGVAAAHFPATWEIDVARVPAPAETAAFVREYEAARGRTFASPEIAAVEAAATYARAYAARCEHAIAADWAGSSRESLRLHGPVRLAR